MVCMITFYAMPNFHSSKHTFALVKDMKASGGVDMYLNSFLPSPLDGSEWLVFALIALVPKKGTWQLPSRSLNGFHNRSGHFAEDKRLLPLLGAELDHWHLSYQWFVVSVVFLTLENFPILLT